MLLAWRWDRDVVQERQDAREERGVERLKGGERVRADRSVEQGERLGGPVVELCVDAREEDLDDNAHPSVQFTRWGSGQNTALPSDGPCKSP